MKRLDRAPPCLICPTVSSAAMTTHPVGPADARAGGRCGRRGFRRRSGLGKMMCACSLADQAVLAGHTVLFTTAGHLLGDLGRWTAIRPCGGAYASMPALICW